MLAMEGRQQAAAAVAEESAQAVASTMLGALAVCLPAWRAPIMAQPSCRPWSALIGMPGLVRRAAISRMRVHPLMAPAMEAEIAARLDCEIAERVVLDPHRAIAPGDARISWQDGSPSIRDTCPRQKRRDKGRLGPAIGLLERELSDA